jgi:hypothetical protein
MLAKWKKDGNCWKISGEKKLEKAMAGERVFRLDSDLDVPQTLIGESKDAGQPE